MNHGLYRLVFDRLRSCLVPVSEATRSRSRAASGGRRARRPAAAAAFAVVMTAFPVLGQDMLPVPAADFATPGVATATINGTTMTVNQAVDRAILNWQSFDIGAGHTVQFQQPSASSIALNRIFDATPSVIAGALRSNGQVYLLNQNGILFANGAQVNVGGLVASTLSISDETFRKGILSVIDGSPVFSWNGSAAQYSTSFVRVDPGAVIRTADGGRVLMFAPRVENAGRIETPGGQTILAAGARVYLEASTDARLRGLLVEVDPLSASQGGTVSNLKVGEAVGEIIAQRGNVTLAGLAVNQNGRITATTTVSANGSIYLLARDTTTTRTTPGDTRVDRLATRAGTLNLGEGSVTQVLPDASSGTSVDAQAFNPSQVVLQGYKVGIARNAAIIAPAGEVSVTALRDPSSPVTSATGAPNNGSRIFVDSGARIDVSGVRNVAVSVERNVVRAELRGNELRDSPVQRGGILQGRAVYVDARVGTDIGDVSGYLAQVERGVNERSAVGGTISLLSEGDVVLRQGSALDVSGGSIQWLAGNVLTTRLVSGGRVFDIGAADRDVVYDSVFEAAPQREAGYVEGRDAGTIRISSRALVLDGTLRGSAINGPRQLDPESAALGGRLILGDDLGGSSGQDYRLPDLQLTAGPGVLSDAFLADPLNASLGARGQRVDVPVGVIRAGGFGRLGFYSNGIARLPLDVVLPAGGTLDVRARRVEVTGDILAPGGVVSLSSSATVTPGLSGVDIGAGSLISTAGRWINDWLDAASGTQRTTAWIDGGSITIESAQDVRLAAGSRLDVSAGARLGTDGRLHSGDGGGITIDTNVGASLPTGVLVLDGSLAGYGSGTGAGGSLFLTARSIRVGGVAQSGEFGVDAGFFQRGGFSTFSLAALESFNVAPGTVVAPEVESLALRADAAGRLTGTAIGSVTQVIRLPYGERDAASIRMTAGDILLGNLTVGEGAVIRTDPGGSISLGAANQLTMLGSLVAPAGSISLSILSRPGQSGDVGLLDNQSLWVGERARLDARGTALLETDARGYRVGEVRGGGKITLSAGRGYVVVEEGAVLDVRGASGTLDLPTPGVLGELYTGRTLHSDGGAIVLESREGILFDGSILAAGGGSTASGGSFRMTLDRRQALLVDGVEFPYPTTERRIDVVSSGNAVPAGLEPGQAISRSQFNGVAVASSARLNGSGLHSVSLVSENRIRFVGDVTLAAPRSVTLEAPVIAGAAGSTARVSAPYVSFGNSSPFYQGAKTGSAGTATLSVQGDLVDVIGALGLQGFSRVDLRSSGDIRLRGALDSSATASELIGSVTGAGTLVFSARQVTPTTLSEFTIDYSASPGSTVRFERAPGAAERPLSAGASVLVKAATIEQNGVLRAPVGAITLEAADVTLGAGSETSVASGGLVIPFGKVENGKDWLYDLRNRVARLFDAPPDKRIELDGTRVNVADGARLDLSGGGDLFAYEFVPGLGGSSDYLGTQGVYAVLPGYRSNFAPFDYQYSTISDLLPGDRITLAGGGGLAAGTYTLLPGHYALLPGAFAVRRVDGYQDMVAGSSIALQGGGAIVSGTTLVAATGAREQRTGGWLVESGTLAGERAQYDGFGANQFFSDSARRDGIAVPRLPGDAGQLVAAATNSLRLDGVIDLAAATGRRGGLLDIVAGKVALLAEGAATPDGFLGVRVAELSRVGAESILVGGTRARDPRGLRVTTGATDVVVSDAGDVLSAGEIVLVASQRITVQDGSRIEAAGAVGNSPASDRLVVSGDGAFLRVSADPSLRLERSGTSRLAGLIEVGDGVSLKGNALEIDGTLDARIASGATLDAAAIGLGASRVVFGPDAVLPAGLTVTPVLLGQLATADRLLFRGYDSVDFTRSITLGEVSASGAASIEALTFDTPVLRGLGDPGTAVVLRAGDIVLTNTTGVVPGAATAGNGTLTLDAVSSAMGIGNLALRDGAVSVTGFSSTTLRAAGTLVSGGTGTLAVGGDLALAAPRIAGEAGTVRTITATGALTTLATGPVPAGATVAGLGTSWTLAARTVSFAGVIDAPSGRIDLRATGGSLTIAEGAVLSAAGVTRSFDGVKVYSDGGRVSLVSDAGGIVLAAGSRVDVSAPAGGGNAGQLSLRASGTIDVAGAAPGAPAASVSGLASAGRGGRLDSYAGAGDGAGLARLLVAASAGGFDAVSSVIGSGNVSLSLQPGSLVSLRELSLSADGGSLEILSDLAAAGGKQRSLGLWSRDDLILGDGVVLSAAGTGAGIDGGSITLGSSGGFIRLGSGSRFDVSAGAGGSTGSVLLRTLRTTAGDGVQLVDGGAIATPGAEVIVEGVRVYSNVTTLSFGSGAGVLNIATVNGHTASFMDSGEAIRDGYAGFVTRVRPGVEVRSTGNLTLASAWNLFAEERPGGEPGMLTLRAAGNLALNAGLSDGFDSVGLLSSGESWSYRLVAGADLASADPMRIARNESPTAGDVTLANDVVVRTGTGFIDVAALRDFRLATSTAALYTAGRASGEIADFFPPDPSAFPTGGGRVSIRAGRDIVGAVSTQLVANWNYRQGTLIPGADGQQVFYPDVNTAWWVRYDRFRQNVGALGGGDVIVSAGRDVSNLSVMLPTNARLPAAYDAQPDPADLIVQGGGDLDLRAGRNVAGGQYLVADGDLRIEAGESLLAGSPAVSGRPALFPIIAAASTRADVRARRDLNLETVFNPTAITQIPENYFDDVNFRSSFFTYDESAAVRLQSLIGDVVVHARADSIALVTSSGPSSDRLVFNAAQLEPGTLTVFPGTLQATALGGDVRIGGNVVLYPFPRGGLELFANGDVIAAGVINMSDYSPSLLPSPATPTVDIGQAMAILNSSQFALAAHGPTLLHRDDPVPVRVVALTGDVVGGPQGQGMAVPKSARVIAGRDVVDFFTLAQNVRGSDTTLVQAGRDVLYTVARSAGTGQLINNVAQIAVAGPGRLDVVAARDIDLGTSVGVITTGNSVNPQLPERGADVRLLSGALTTLNADAFLTGFPDIQGKAGQDLVDLMRDLLGRPDLSREQAFAEFRKLDAATQKSLATEVASSAFFRRYLQPAAGGSPEGLYRKQWVEHATALGIDANAPGTNEVLGFRYAVLFPELRAAGRAAVTGGATPGNYSRGFDAISLSQLGGAFESSGDVNLIFSQVKTQRGGEIEILAPGGGANVGLATPPVGFSKGADSLGILSVRGGDVRAFVRNNFNVNQSRVFTLEGGDILVWSSVGDIDAGRGAKTAISVPPPVVRINSAGELVVEFPGAASGSGIGVLLTRPDIVPGDVDLIAPAGTVNAGDAGIRAAGNLTIAAVRVVGAENIQVGGVSAGVPVAASGSTSLGSVGNVAAEASKSAERATQSMSGDSTPSAKKAPVPSFITVEVIGMGDDEDPRNRNRTQTQ